jgi:hypothetical protein
MSELVIPLVILGGLAAYVGGLGIEHAWMLGASNAPVPYLSNVISAALHASWIFAAARRRAPLLIAAGWFLSRYFCQEGLTTLGQGSGSFACSTLAEVIPLLLALALTPRSTWGEKLARWRRARSEISIQLRMGEGLMSWFPPAVRQFLFGSAVTAAGSSYRRYLAEMADAEHVLRVRLSSLTIPEHLRQSILTSAGALVGQAEKSAAALAIHLEREALNAAAACRDQCEELEDLQPQERAVLAKQCEALFLELVHPGQSMQDIRARSL